GPLHATAGPRLLAGHVARVDGGRTVVVPPLRALLPHPAAVPPTGAPPPARQPSPRRRFPLSGAEVRRPRRGVPPRGDRRRAVGQTPPAGRHDHRPAGAMAAFRRSVVLAAGRTVQRPGGGRSQGRRDDGRSGVPARVQSSPPPPAPPGPDGRGSAEDPEIVDDRPGADGRRLLLVVLRPSGGGDGPRGGGRLSRDRLDGRPDSRSSEP